MERIPNQNNYPDVKLVDPVSRFNDFEYTFPPPAFPALQKDFENPPDCGEKSYKGRGRLQGLKALITGGDSGIGRAIVIAFVREGAKVAINYLPEEEPDAEELATFLKRGGHSIERIPGDLRSEEFCAELVKQAARRLGGLDILINNAGYAMLSSEENAPYKFSTAELHRTFATNVFAPFFLTRAAVPYLPRGGSIIFTASNVVVDPQAFVVDYGASKGAVTYMVRGLSQQLLPNGIRVNGVAPGPVYTPLWASSGFLMGVNTTDLLDGLVAQYPYRRMAQPAELAPLYVSLAEPSQTYTSGEIFSCVGATLGT